VSVDQVVANFGTNMTTTDLESDDYVSVDQVVANFGTATDLLRYEEFVKCPSIRLLPTSAPS